MLWGLVFFLSSEVSGLRRMAFPTCNVAKSDETVNWESQRCAQSFSFALKTSPCEEKNSKPPGDLSSKDEDLTEKCWVELLFFRFASRVQQICCYLWGNIFTVHSLVPLVSLSVVCFQPHGVN